MSAPDSRATFFRQSGWMALAALLGGVFNMASAFVGQRMAGGEYNIFETALSALGILSIPALGMQAAFAAQTAGADTPERRHQLGATLRGAIVILTTLWLGLAAWWLARADVIMKEFKLTQPAMLWVLLLIVLVNLWSPVFNGVLQGRQNFLWFGWAVLLNGVGRLVVLWLVVWQFHLGALGALWGFLAGCLVVLGLVTWQALPDLTTPRVPTDWRAWLGRVIPVTCGLGALSFIMQFDQLAQRGNVHLSADDADGFSAVRKIAQALVFVVGALTSVMYPKVARSFQRSQASDVLRLTLLLTALIAAGGATLATLFPELPLRILSPSRLWAAKSLVPPYCWALVPLALSNVLVWNLLARECYRAVPWMVAIAIACWLVLQARGTSILAIIGIVAACNTLLCLTCAAFAWQDLRSRRDRA